MKLVPFSEQYLAIGMPLPFGLRDGTGRLLLIAGVAIRDAEQLRSLGGQALFAEENEAAEWNRRLAAAMDQQLRRNATLKEVAQARPEWNGRDAGAELRRSLAEEWQECVLQLDAALRDVRADGDWADRVHAAHERARSLVQRRCDASLYLLVYEAAHSTFKYSCHHAMLVMVVCELTAPLLGWSEAWVQAIGRAALLMNVSMLRLQDQLAATEMRLGAEVRAQIACHPAAGADLLEEGGCTDRLLLDTVRWHHDASDLASPLAGLPPARQLARLLRRVDIFTAKLSRRATRSPMSPVQAAREACLGPKGTPDEIGAALLKAVGLYPPGSFVELSSGEIGIVLARGRRANLPIVASLVSPSGSPLGEPALRDTVETRHAVKSAVATSAVRVRPPHDKLLALR